MRTTPIGHPLVGERVVAVEPEMKPMVEANWHRRLRFYTGRSLSDKALITEQVGRAGRLATRGQMVSAGIVSGLVLGMERPPKIIIETIADTPLDVAGPPPAEIVPMPPNLNYFFHISPGTAIAASGEDIVLSRNVRVPLGSIPVYTTTDILAKLDESNGRDESPGAAINRDTIDIEMPVERKALIARRLGPSFREFVTKGVTDLPRAAVLVLEPIVLKRVSDYDPSDQCEQDPQNYAFEDWQLVDGCRLILYTWPTELTDILPLPDPDSKAWRNRLAYTIFEAEMRGADDETLLPWEEIGVPIGLVGFDAEFAPLFVDRYSVVRAGGKPKPRSVLVPDITKIVKGEVDEDSFAAASFTPLLPNAGNAFVWQARLEQFAEQMADSDLNGASINQAIEQFDSLPPTGVLPKTAVDIDLKGCTNHFFPPNFRLTAVPVPIEQLDVAIEQSAPLKFLDTSLFEEVRLLVPVPQVFYEPNLLREEEPDPEFEQNIESTEEKLGAWLTRRAFVYQRGKTINAQLNGATATYPDLDLREGETPSGTQQITDDPELSKPVEEAYGTIVKSGATAEIFDDLQSRLRQSAPFMAKELDETIGGTPSNRMARLGLIKFISFLEEKVKRADDIVDFGFVRVQTDLYRHRQLMLGSIDASRLATSPALAAIAKGETALATKEDIIKFLNTARSTQSNLTRSSGSAPSGSEGGTIAATVMAGTASVNESNLVDRHASGELRTEMASGVSAGSAISAEEIFSSSSINAATENISAMLPFMASTSTAQKASITTNVAATATAATLFGAQTQAYTKAAVYQQSSIVGYALDFRNVTVAERIKDAPAPEAKNFTVSSKYEILRALEELSEVIVMDDLQFPGFWDYGVGNNELQTDSFPTIDQHNQPITIRVPRQKLRNIDEIKTMSLAAEVLAGRHDPDPTNGDEAAFFGVGVRASDKSVAILRIIEGRIQSYRNVIELCKQTLDDLNSSVDKINSRLKVIEDFVAEARHDLSVAKVLLGEEKARVAAINDRREKVLAEHLLFLAYQRPRKSDLVNETKLHELDPAFVESPVPACLSRHVTPPLELRSMIEVVRHAPVKWFVNVRPLLDKFDRMEYLQATALSAKVRAAMQFPVMQQIAEATSFFGNLGQAIGNVVSAQRQVVSRYRAQTAQLDMSEFASQSWTLVRDRVREAISLGDLIDPNHGRSDVSRQAADELENITHVATCLYSSLGTVLPVIRLEWAERISQYDAPIDLHNLSSLPRWGEIKYLDRREMQTFVDWLFSRIDRNQSEAVLLINDLVRVCILLASHAPINEIIAGRLMQPVEVKEGGRFHLAVDLAKVRVGMHVLMYNANEVVARGVVEDLSSGQVATRVTQVNSLAKIVSLSTISQFQIAEAGAFDRNPLMITAG